MSTETDPAVEPIKFAIFTDFDGTLVDIAETPDGVRVPSTLPVDLTTASRKLDSAFAIVTGRTIADIDKYLSPAVLPVAGTHGAQRRRADGTYEAVSEAAMHDAGTIADRLRPLVDQHPQLILEAKTGAVALHYRQAPDLEVACRQAMEAAIANLPEFDIVAGKMVFEARQKQANKGEAIKAFMCEAPFAGRVPVFVGDDTTDEDGFEAVQSLGGIGIKLGPGDTKARLRLPDVAAARRLILALAERTTDVQELTQH